MKKKLSIVYFLIIGLTISSCASGQLFSPTVTPTSTATTLPTSTFTPLLTFTPPPTAVMPQTTCERYDNIIVGENDYIVQPGIWNDAATQPQCITVQPDTGAFTIVRADNQMGVDGNPGSYVHISKGCHWGDCTTESGLPLQIGKIKAARSSWSVTTISTGVWNVVLELWINTTPSAIQGADGAEIMIWLNSNNMTPYGNNHGAVSISGYTWNVTRAQFSTPFIVYRSTTDLTMVNDLDMKAFLDDVVSRGWIQKDWYLITAQAGFELWNGGAGLSSDSFSFTASGTP